MTYIPSKNLKVLVVDDEPMNLRLLSEALEILGMQVVAETDPAKALRHYHKAPFDLVVTDINMPGMDGNALLREIHNCNGLQPIVIAATANPALVSGNFDAILLKPYRLRDLWQCLESALPLNHLEQHKPAFRTRVHLGDSYERRNHARTTASTKTANITHGTD